MDLVSCPDKTEFSMSGISSSENAEHDLKLVDLEAPEGIPPRLFSLVKPPIEKLISLKTLNETYRGIRQRIPEQAVCDEGVAEMDGK